MDELLTFIYISGFWLRNAPKYLCRIAVLYPGRVPVENVISSRVTFTFTFQNSLMEGRRKL